MLRAGMGKDIGRKLCKNETKSIGFITLVCVIDLKPRILSNFGAREKHWAVDVSKESLLSFGFVSARRKTRSNNELEILSQYLQDSCVHHSHMTIIRSWFQTEDIVHFGYISSKLGKYRIKLCSSFIHDNN